MSEFTKEELTMMAAGIVFIKSQYKMSDETRNMLDELDSKLSFMINNCEKYKFKVPDDMDSSALAWRYQHDE